MSQKLINKAKQIFDLLLADNLVVNFNETGFGFFLQKIYLPYLTEIFVSVTVIGLWYEKIFNQVGIDIGKFTPWFLVFALLFSEKKDLKIRKSHLYFILFLIASLVSGVFSVFVFGVIPKIIILGWLIFAGFGLAIVAGGVIKMKLEKMLVFIFLPLTAIGLTQFIFKIDTSKEWISRAENINTRIFSLFSSPNVFALLLVFISLLSLGMFLKKREGVFFIFFSLNLFALILTFSRSAWLAFLVGVFILFVVKYKKILLFSPLVLLIFAFNSIKERIMIVFSQNYLVDSLLDGRIWSAINGLYLFQKSPLLGAGPGSYGGLLALNYASPIYLLGIQHGYTALYFTDNQWLEILVQTGFLGLLLFSLFYFLVIKNLIIKYLLKQDIMYLVAIAILVAFFVAGQFENVLEFGAVSIPIGLFIGKKLNEA